MFRLKRTRPRKFLSTPSARRATVHRQRHGRCDDISIHALCEEGDCRFITCSTSAKLFLSTPSARRATPDYRLQDNDYSKFLSTPSARRATSRSSFRSRPAAYFYPRPLRGGRLTVEIRLTRHN